MQNHLGKQWLTFTDPRPDSAPVLGSKSAACVCISARYIYPHPPTSPCYAPLKRGETLCNVTFRIFSFDFKFAKVARCQLSWKYCKLRQSHVQVYRHLALPARQPQRGANARATDNCSVANFVALLRCQLKAEPPKLPFQHWRAIK